MSSKSFPGAVFVSWMPVAALSIVTAGLLTACAPEATQAAGAPSAPSVQVAQVIVRQLEAATQHSAEIEAAERAQIRPRVAGQIEARTPDRERCARLMSLTEPREGAES